MPFKNKTILFSAPINFGFSEAIRSELEILGFKVIDISDVQLQKFKYSSLGHRLHNFIRKTVYNDRSFKDCLRAQQLHTSCMQRLDTLPTCDYGLFIRPDLYTLEFIQYVKQKVGHLVAYQWDGLNRYPSSKEYIDIFDKFYIFDKQDLSEHTLPATNFYLQSKAEKLDIKNDAQHAYFLGTHHDKRFQKVLELKNILKAAGFKDNFILYTDSESKKEKIEKNGITCIDSYLNYTDNLTNTLMSSLLIDIHIPIHNGLSFRLFESLGYNKKVITTNPEAKKYDFFHPDNVFILKEDNVEELEGFLHRPYKELDHQIKNKYSFENWIKYILDIDDYIPISLP